MTTDPLVEATRVLSRRVRDLESEAAGLARTVLSQRRDLTLYRRAVLGLVVVLTAALTSILLHS